MYCVIKPSFTVVTQKTQICVTGPQCVKFLGCPVYNAVVLLIKSDSRHFRHATLVPKIAGLLPTEVRLPSEWK
jgi:hypothetical protein